MVQTIHERRKSPMKYWEWHCKQRRMCVYHFYFTSTIVPAMVLFLHLWYNSSREIALCIADVMKNYWYIGWYTTVQKADKIREKRTFFLHPINRKNISKRILVFILNKTVSSQNIEILDKTVVYEHLERYRFKFQSLFSINVVGNTPINSHLERLKWSAGFIPEVVAVKQNQKIEYDKDPLSYNQIEKQNINIIFPNGKTISKNDEPYRTGFKILNLYDEKHISKPILVVGIYNITKNLTLKVYFPENLYPIEIRGLKYAHFIDEEPYDSIPLKLQHDDENNKYYVEFFIKTPIYGGKYAIDWGFND